MWPHRCEVEEKCVGLVHRQFLLTGIRTANHMKVDLKYTTCCLRRGCKALLSKGSKIMFDRTSPILKSANRARLPRLSISHRSMHRVSTCARLCVSYGLDFPPAPFHAIIFKSVKSSFPLYTVPAMLSSRIWPKTSSTRASRSPLAYWSRVEASRYCCTWAMRL